MRRLRCPYFDAEVEFDVNRERHIRETHPELFEIAEDIVAATVRDPEQVRRSTRARNAYMLSRWYPEVRGGKHGVVVVVEESSGRYWVVTAYLARRLVTGEVLWTRS